MNSNSRRTYAATGEPTQAKQEAQNEKAAPVAGGRMLLADF